MNEKNPQALAVAYRRAVAKSERIKELGITPESTPEELNAIIKQRAEDKAEQDGGEWTKYVKGQRWYIEDLHKFSAFSAEDRLEYEYQQSFPDTASESELLASLSKIC